MNREDFDKSIEATFERCKNTLIHKSKEYTPDDDPLNNFKEGSDMSGRPMEEVLFMYCLKHLVSLRDIIFKKVPCDSQLLQEKTGDIINYLAILNAMNDANEFKKSSQTFQNYL
ncbi:MAG: hypothetical protein IJ122_06370 [Methanobrevibacter sp.]|nr:hypothetical protein [Methanobrevibacter sp.]